MISNTQVRSRYLRLVFPKDVKGSDIGIFEWAVFYLITRLFERTNEMKSRMNMLIADDHPVFRRGLREIIGESTRFGIVGEAADGAIGLRMAAELQPDIIVLDVDMPHLNGLQMARELRRLRRSRHRREGLRAKRRR